LSLFDTDAADIPADGGAVPAREEFRLTTVIHRLPDDRTDSNVQSNDTMRRWEMLLATLGVIFAVTALTAGATGVVLLAVQSMRATSGQVQWGTVAQWASAAGKPLVDVILDEAEQKGTGRWTVKSALDLGVPVTGIAEAVFARALSGSVTQRKATTGLASGALGEKPSDTDKFVEDVRQALYASKIVAYAQGFNHIQAGSAEYDWGITPGDLATIWRGGCIIRAKFLNRIKEAFDQDPDLPTLITAPYFRSAVENAIDSWRRVVVTATELGIPIPGFSSALSYYDALRTERLPAALTQGLRDFFGAHTYGRIDADPSQKFHTLWSADRTEVSA
jgi:6-phosphogluconate dehydrogenase (decarboxylating)